MTLDIEPTDKDIEMILDYMGGYRGDDEALAPYRETARRIFEKAAADAVHELLWRNIQRDIHRMAAPSPSVMSSRWEP